MAYVKLFESWLAMNEAEEVDPTSVAKTFPIDTKQWGSMEEVANKSSTDLPGLATYLGQKLKALTKNLPVKFKVAFNKSDGTVDITPEDNPKLKFRASGSLYKPKNAASEKQNPYGKTMFNYSGWIKDGEEEIVGDTQAALDYEQGGDWRLGEFLSAVIQKKDVYDMKGKQSPKDFALNVALTYDSSKEGKPATLDNIVTKITSGSPGDNLAPKEQK